MLLNFLPLVDGLLNDYHHLLCRLVGSIYQNHQLLVLGPPRQWLAFRYSNLSETKVLPLGELLFGELLAALSTILLLWVMPLHPRLLPVSHDPTLADFFLGLSP